MHVLVTDPSSSGAEQLKDRLTGVQGVSQVTCIAHLAGAYTIAEHEVPDIAIISAELADKPEFEGLLLLFRALKIQSGLFQPASVSSEDTEHHAARLGLEVFPICEVTAWVQSKAARPHGETPGFRQRRCGGAEAPFDDGIILLGASTGGVDALIQVLSSFPANCPRTFVVQHTGAQFTNGLARLLDGHVAPKVVEADPGVTPRTGQVHVAPGGRGHLQISVRGPVTTRLVPPEQPKGHCPSVDALFLSARSIADQVSAGLLTGMGRDGAEGMLSLRKSGARTFVQDEKTSVVYGMPKAAFDMGAAEKRLPLNEIGPALLASRKERS